MSKFGGRVKIVYTPVHGTGYMPVTTVLARMGINVTVVPEQAKPDSEFFTVRVPNPEEADTLRMGVELADKIGSDVVIGTDPDADRMGVAIRDDKGKFVLLNGNRIGVLLADYIMRRKKKRERCPQTAQSSRQSCPPNSHAKSPTPTASKPSTCLRASSS